MIFSIEPLFRGGHFGSDTADDVIRILNEQGSLFPGSQEAVELKHDDRITRLRSLIDTEAFFQRVLVMQAGGDQEAPAPLSGAPFSKGSCSVNNQLFHSGLS